MREASRPAGGGELDRCRAQLRAGADEDFHLVELPLPDWTRSDRGRRLDHIWVAPALADRLSAVTVSKDSRGWSRPSDHVPVTATLEV
jgi:exodeoxyribonuclease-3